MNDLVELIPLFILLGLLNSLVGLLKTRYGNHKIVSILTSPRAVYLLLIGWTAYGFLTNLDYSQQWGCIISHEPIFSIENIIFSGIAIGLISIGGGVSNKQIGTLILLAELIFWLFKLFLIKGGYVVGFGGVPSIEVLSFDIIALTLRLLLLSQVSQLYIRSIWILTLAFIIMGIKVQFFRW
ncbi:hypothetical protein [Flexithrix dorotheae]|uniref:hypothetical protein n=1 Tax=Flexithrix dorotheae TaxID=70993 RepID=UPI0012FCF499|nr:hypothetical protein [Flexithrix dorotheae]